MREHARAGEMEEIAHQRAEDTALAGVVRILGMPIGVLIAIGSLVLSLFGVWYKHDRAIAESQTQVTRNVERIQKLEAHDDKRSDTDAAVAAALMRIETKLDDVKERVERVETRQGQK